VNIGNWPVRPVLLSLLLVGCVPVTPSTERDQAVQAELATLRGQVTDLSGQVTELGSTITAMRSEQQAMASGLDVQNRVLDRVEDGIEELPKSLKQLCPPARVVENCKEPAAQRVVVSGNRMVVGEMEQVWLDPPGATFDARIDPTFSGNALRAEDIVEFERDGHAWVRFALRQPDSDKRIEVERRVSGHRRAFQTASGESIKRPVIKLRLKLGDVEDTFSFVLTDRADIDFQALLGRSFLKDIAYLEIGAQYVQPRIKASATKAAAPARKTTAAPNGKSTAK
jgi:outer membrane murein-binding lipoprotein Lpp